MHDIIRPLNQILFLQQYKNKEKKVFFNMEKQIMLKRKRQHDHILQQKHKLYRSFFIEEKEKISIIDINNNRKEVQINLCWSGIRLKKFIYQTISSSLDVNDMNIFKGDTKIQDITTLRKIIKKNDVIKQLKKSPSQIKGINYYPDQQCSIYCEKGVVLMPCGHKIGPKALQDHLQTQIIKFKKTEIQCCFSKCKVIWPYQFCFKVCNFTVEQRQRFQSQITENLLKANIIQCPSCQSKLLKTQLRVGCPKCSNNDFCSECLRHWKGSNSKKCGYEDCLTKTEILGIFSTKEHSMWSYKDQKKEQKIYKNYTIPACRICPKCQILIIHKESCKHMQCENCKNSFCFVCLSIKQKDKVWTCGSYGQYCGNIAPVQKQK